MEGEEGVVGFTERFRSWDIMWRVVRVLGVSWGVSGYIADGVRMVYVPNFTLCQNPFFPFGECDLRCG